MDVVIKRTEKTEIVDLSFLSSFALVEDKVAFKLLNVENNAELLEEVPYFRYLDMAIVFYCIVENSKDRLGTILVNNELFSTWGISREKLYKTASANTKRLFGVEIMDIKDLIIEMITEGCGNDGPSEDFRNDLTDQIRNETQSFPMYVLSNRARINGAVCMVFSDIGNFADEIDDDIYIIPSSVHEVILVPASQNIMHSQLRQILCDVNEKELAEQDILSDNVYKYERSCRRISMC